MEWNYVVEIYSFYPKLLFLKDRKVFEGSGEKKGGDAYANSFGFGERNGRWYKMFFNGNGVLTTAYKLGYRITGYNNVFSHYSKGGFVGEVGAKDINAFPKDGQKGSFWYEFIN